MNSPDRSELDDSEVCEITTLYNKFTQIQISSDKQTHSLQDFDSSNAALEKEIMELQEQLRNECNHDRILDEDYKLITIRKNNMEETLQLCEQARDLENQETEELEQHLAELKARLNKRRDEFDQNMQKLIEASRARPASYALQNITSEIQRIEREYQLVERTIKILVEELDGLKKEYEEVDVDQEETRKNLWHIIESYENQNRDEELKIRSSMAISKLDDMRKEVNKVEESIKLLKNGANI